jgi:hypothetical protein
MSILCGHNTERTPMNREPHLHSARELPEQAIPVVKFGIEQYQQGITYDEVYYRWLYRFCVIELRLITKKITSLHKDILSLKWANLYLTRRLS